MKKLIILSLLTISHSTKASTDLWLSVDESKTLKASSSVIRNSNSKAVRVRDIGGAYLLTALKKGVSNVTVGNRHITVRVLDSETKHFALRVTTELKRLKGLTLRWRLTEPQITGYLYRLSDWITIKSLAQEYQAEFTWQAQVAIEDQSELKHVVLEELRKNLLSDVQVTFTPQLRAFIPHSKKDDLSSYKRVLSSMGIPLELSTEAVVIEPVIGVKILVTEMRKSSLVRFGIRYASAYQASLLPKFSADPSQATVSLEALEENGLAKILASPHLICKNGKEAKFLAGGEIPIRVVSSHVAQITWKRYGVLLNVKPKADVSGRMSLHINTEISTIDSSHTVDGIPGFLTNSIETHFDLSESRTIALSGLLKNEQGRSSEGLPLLSRIPILGSLFSSKDYRQQESELVILVTPKVMEGKNWN